MKRLATVLFAVLILRGAVAADSPNHAEIMDLREEPLETLKKQVASPGAAVIYIESRSDWHCFYFTHLRTFEYDVSRGSGAFRCKDLKLVSTKGRELTGSDRHMARVRSVNVEQRMVVIDLEDETETLRRSDENAEKKSSNQRPQGTPRKEPSSSTEPDARRP